MKNIKKVILITGGSSGIGYDSAIALAKQGHKVYAAARRVKMMEPSAIKTNWGIIAADNLEASSRGTVYEERAINEANNMHKAYRSNFFSKPKVVTKAICKAVNRRRPRTRYCIGRGGKMIIFLHSVLPTRWWDRINRIMTKKVL